MFAMMVGQLPESLPEAAAAPGLLGAAQESQSATHDDAVPGSHGGEGESKSLRLQAKQVRTGGSGFEGKTATDS